MSMRAAMSHLFLGSAGAASSDADMEKEEVRGKSLQRLD